MKETKTILVAPLNWGLGHATRCIPIILALQEDGYKVMIASDGDALELLKKEFPHLPLVKLPSYNVSYTEQGSRLKQKLIASIPRFIKAIKAENKKLAELIKKYSIDGVISDSRFGLYSNKVPTVFITHQLRVLSGSTTWLSTYLHTRFIKRFTECWVPDYEETNNLSGALGHPKKHTSSIRYIGPLSRFKACNQKVEYKATAILSGPEPQRRLLEEILLRELKKYVGPVLIVRGVIEDEQVFTKKGQIQIVNYLTTPQLEKVIDKSEFIISRSGYTTLMDLARLGKKAFFIPTPGQTEQEYLAQRLKEKGIAPFSTQDQFKIKDLAKVAVYKGFKKDNEALDLRQFFGLFEGKRELRPNAQFTFNIDFLFMRLNNMLHNRKA